MKIISLIKSIFHKNNHFHNDKYYSVKGYGTTSNYCHVKGNGVTASGSCSRAEGHGAKAKNDVFDSYFYNDIYSSNTDSPNK